MSQKTPQTQISGKKPTFNQGQVDISIYVFQMPKFYSICSVWTSCEFFVSHEALGSLFFSSSFSVSLPRFPLFLFLFNPKHCFRRHHFFRNAKLVYAETQESTKDQLYIQLKKTLPSAGIKHGSSQSKSDHASHSATVNPQTEGYIYE